MSPDTCQNAIIKKQEIACVGEVAEKRTLLALLVGFVNAATLENSTEAPPKI